MLRAKDFVQAAGISKTFDLNKKMKCLMRLTYIIRQVESSLILRSMVYEHLKGSLLVLSYFTFSPR